MFSKKIRYSWLVTLALGLGWLGPAGAAHTAGMEEPSYRYQEAECDEIVLRYHWLHPLPGYGTEESPPKVTAPGLLLGLGMIITAPLMLLDQSAPETTAPDTLEELEHAGIMKSCPEIIEQRARDLQEDNPEFSPAQ